MEIMLDKQQTVTYIQHYRAKSAADIMRIELWPKVLPLRRSYTPFPIEAALPLYSKCNITAALTIQR